MAIQAIAFLATIILLVLKVTGHLAIGWLVVFFPLILLYSITFFWNIGLMLFVWFINRSQ